MADRRERMADCVKRIWETNFNGYYPGAPKKGATPRANIVAIMPPAKKAIAPGEQHHDEQRMQLPTPTSVADVVHTETNQRVNADQGARTAALGANESDSGQSPKTEGTSDSVVNQIPDAHAAMEVVQGNQAGGELVNGAHATRRAPFATHEELAAALDTPNFYNLASEHFGINRFPLSQPQKETFNVMMQNIVRGNEAAFARPESEFRLPFSFDASEVSQHVLDLMREHRKRNLPECPLVKKHPKKKW